jgi:hypothetical protein
VFEDDVERYKAGALKLKQNPSPRGQPLSINPVLRSGDDNAGASQPQRGVAGRSVPPPDAGSKVPGLPPVKGSQQGSQNPHVPGMGLPVEVGVSQAALTTR